MDIPEGMKALVEEYRDLLGQAAEESPEPKVHDSLQIESVLYREGEWSLRAAKHLHRLANGYGSFMLRNALALSLALGIEDGELGF
jgi:hypothetical protein